MNKTKSPLIVISLFTLIIQFGCVEVKPYQRMYLDDYDMNLSNESVKGYEDNFQNYRESATGGSSAKAGGGCGCN